MSLIQVIKHVPLNIFGPALVEIDNIEWNNEIDPNRSNNLAFSSSTAIHLRGHKPPIGVQPTSVEEWSMITQCVDVPTAVYRFPNILSTSKWIFSEVNGIELGKIMIVNLHAGGGVLLHVDPLDYFEMYSRYHIPFRTNTAVLFSGGPDTLEEHMPYGYLCRLNNRLPHMLVNRSDDYRIHLIVDIKTSSLNEIF